jgi:pantetheine-phosphate adenylyltransferase
MSFQCALVPGTYDPVTHGHINVILRTSQIFERVIVAVAESPKKGAGPMFSLEERCAFIVDAVAGLTNVEVRPFTGLLVDFAKENGASVIVKGLRAVTDFDSEFQQASINHKLDPELETILIMSDPEHMFLSSSMVKEIASHGGKIDAWVTDLVKSALQERFKGQ